MIIIMKRVAADDVSYANQLDNSIVQQQQQHLPLCLARVSVSTYGTHTRTLSMNTSALL